MGVHGMYALMNAADRRDEVSGGRLAVGDAGELADGAVTRHGALRRSSLSRG